MTSDRPLSRSVGESPSDGSQSEDLVAWRNGTAWIENCSVPDIAATHGTPVFVISEDRLRSNAQRFQQAFRSHWPGKAVRILPSAKANYLLAVRAILTEEGMGCDTFGPGELYAARRAAVPPRLVSVNGSVKDRELIRQAIDYGARITLDNAGEALLVIEEAREAGRVARVHARVRPDYSTHSETTDLSDTGTSVYEFTSRYKPGISLDELRELGPKLVAAEELEFCGLMTHIGRHRNDLTFWRGVMESYAASIAELSREWDWLPEELDVGGGFAARRDPFGRLRPSQASRPADDVAPSIEDYASAVGPTLAGALEAHGIDPGPITLEVEPGRSMFTDAGVHLTSVRNVKREAQPGGERWWVETDTTQMFLTDGVLEQSRFLPQIVNKRDDKPHVVVDIVGLSCQSDRIASDVVVTVGVTAGDLLLLPDTGAYLEASATNFNALPRPATVLVTNEKHEVIKRAESVEEVFARDVVPRRLSRGATA